MATKVQEIKFKVSDVFKRDSKLTFFDSNTPEAEVPKIIFLVGNNGSGKTSVLNYLYNGLAEGRKGYYGSTNLTKGTKFDLHVTSESSPIETEVDQSGIKSSKYPDDVKVVFDEVNTTFNIEKIKAVTALTADENTNPKERASELGKVIPQLLANIKAEDDAYVADYITENGEIPEYTRKLDRFTKAFDRMYEGKKKFKKILNEDGEKKIIFLDDSGNEVNMSTFSTGEKQIVFRVGNLLKNLKNLQNGIILIDEPETSLHPKWQRKYIQFLLNTFDGLGIQFIISTHSPYILQGIKDGESIAIKIDRNKTDEQGNDILDIGEKIGYYPNSLKNPSINLINYLAYGIVDELLHIELFTALEVKNNVNYTGLKRILDADNSILQKNHTATVSYGRVNIGDSISEALPVYIRNTLHHPDERARNYSQEELENSINIMLDLLK
ncbi:ATP-binding protein [Leeuwenhoekiella aequorea]|uniref:AAA family ATPase n=1 Tax=Leeuwenhoekiella aequorea TaxID=283736 RepID=UPI00352DD97A|tara:strand:+ start:602 stop:1921 length:1320 start_codon:yes stop_codon:yes gene_type:complete